MKNKLSKLALAALLSLTAASANAATHTIDIMSMIDGEAEIIIKDDSIQWHNFNHVVAGVDAADSNITPTTISYSIDGVLKQTVNWYQSWPTPNYTVDGVNVGDQFSDIFSGLSVPISSATSAFTLTPILNRYWTSISQPSDALNALVIHFDDRAPLGSAIYRSSISFTAPVPEADTSAMLLMGAGVMGFMARRRKQTTS